MNYWLKSWGLLFILAAIIASLVARAQLGQQGQSQTDSAPELVAESRGLSQGWANMSLHHATNQVYAILTKTNLSDANWSIETVVWPATNQTDALPLAVQQLGRQALFFRVVDWTGVTENGNTVPDWWLWKYFGTVKLSDAGADLQGRTLLHDYRNGVNPNFTYSTGGLGADAPLAVFTPLK